MKNKLRFLSLFAIAATIGFTACSDEDDFIEADHNRPIKSISQARLPRFTRPASTMPVSAMVTRWASMWWTTTVPLLANYLTRATAQTT